MELLKVQQAKAVWLFDTQELNPRGLSLADWLPSFFGKFQPTVWPKLEEYGTFNAGTSGLAFRNGRFMFGALRVEFSFELYTDGIVVNSRNSTEASEAIIGEFCDWARKELTAVVVPKKQQYRSELVLRASAQFENVSSNLQRYAIVLSQVFGQPTFLTGVIFGSESTTGVLTLERRANATLQDNQYFSSSALHTAQHLKALEELEVVLK